MIEPKIIPQQFQVQSNSIASYNYTDIAEGTGVVIFYAANTQDNSTKSYFLTADTPHSNNVLTMGNTATTTATKLLDIDFDVTFNRPKIIKGKVKGFICWQQGEISTANKGGTSWVIMKVRKWDGTTETELASNTKSKVLTTGDNVINAEAALVIADITSRVHFKTGETLRITIELYTDGDTGGSKAALFHDPQNRIPENGSDYGYGDSGVITNTADSSQTRFYIPFILEEIGA